MANTSIQSLNFDRLLSALQSRSDAEKWIECAVWIALEITIFTGNILTLKIILTNKDLRTIPNYLIVSLACSDLGLGIFGGIPTLGVLVEAKWPFNEALCQLQGVSALTMASASVLNLTLMAINRYFKVVKTRRYQAYFTKRRTLAYIALVWLMAFLVAASYLLIGNRYSFNPGKVFCFIQPQHHIFQIFISIVYITFPSAVILYCYQKVYMVIKTHNKALSGWGARRIDPKVGRAEHWADHKARAGPGTHARGISVQEINITRTLFSIVVAFLVCWTPAFVIDIIDVYQLRWSLGRRAYVSYTFLVATSSTVNPILYGIMNPAFRKEYLKCLVYLRIQNNSVVTTNTSPSNRDSKI